MKFLKIVRWSAIAALTAFGFYLSFLGLMDFAGVL